MRLKNKSILIYGLGVTGRELIKFMIQKKANVFIYDDKNHLKIENTQWLNAENEVDFLDFVVISPGIGESKVLSKLKLYNIPIYSELKFASMFTKGKIIAVTGTNGKTTTVNLLSEIFKSAKIKHCLCGNVGLPLISCLNKKVDYYICEVSSFQLENLGDFKPYISVLLNVAPDHLSRHKTMENYTKIKFSIFENVKRGAVINLSLKNIEFEQNVNCLKKFFSGYSVADAFIDCNVLTYEDVKISCDKLKLQGNKNYENVLACIIVAKMCNISAKHITEAVTSFKGLEHRIEFVCNYDNVTYINDSKATNPDSTCSALECFKNVILLLGGFDKGLSFDNIFKFKNIKKVVLFGQAKHEIYLTAKKFGFKNVFLSDSLFDAVSIAKNNAVTGDVILFSPACSSYDSYKNYEERGADFKRICYELNRRDYE